MRRSILMALVLLMVWGLFQNALVQADYCAECKGKARIANIGVCRECGQEKATSGANMYCPDCSKKLGRCEDCGKELPKPEIVKKDDPKRPHIDIVFAFDSTGSMQDIIAAAQKKIWAIVNQMGGAKPAPVIRVGLIAYRGEREECYGGTGFKVWDLSDDLDKVYEQLMAFKADNGERECVGRAIYEATNSVSWDKGKDTFKVIFVLGNEPANQDSDQEKYGYKKGASGAVKQDININTIYCAGGGYPNATPEWKEIATLADGVFTTISLEGKVVEISTPMDKEIVELNGKLNQTYLAYGAKGDEKKELQEAMDKASNSVAGQAAPSAPLAERTLTKAGKGYYAGAWDLIDAMKNKDFKLETVKDEELPEEMRKMTPEERRTYLEKKAKEREDIQKQIQELGKKREQYIKKEMEKQKLTGDEFDQVINKTLRQQAEKKGFKFEENKSEEEKK